MDGILLRHWPKGLGGAFALLLGLSLLSFDLQDPTLTNLRMPSGGIANWSALPGALIGGTLLELLGTSALATPLLWLNWVLCARSRPPLYLYAGWCTCLLLAVSGLHGLFIEFRDPGLLAPGLAGWALQQWAHRTTGTWGAVAVLTYIGGYAVPRIVYAPAVHTALRDARVFARWTLREGWRGWRDGVQAVQQRAGRMRRVAGATTLGLVREAGLGVAGVVSIAISPLWALGGWVAALRSPSLGRIKERSSGHPADSVAARLPSGGYLPDPAEGLAAATLRHNDGFGGWYQREDAPTSNVEAIDPGLAVTQGPSATTGSDVSRAPTPEDRTGRLLAVLGSTDDEIVDEPGSAAESGDELRDIVRDAALRETFEQPEAEAAWRERFQRYARNLDLDWEEQLWRKTDPQEEQDDTEQDADR